MKKIIKTTLIMGWDMHTLGVQPGIPVVRIYSNCALLLSLKAGSFFTWLTEIHHTLLTRFSEAGCLWLPYVCRNRKMPHKALIDTWLHQKTSKNLAAPCRGLPVCGLCVCGHKRYHFTALEVQFGSSLLRKVYTCFVPRPSHPSFCLTARHKKLGWERG